MNKEYIVETSKITLKRNNVDGTFTMSVYDNNGHYLDDIYLDCMEVMDLYNGLEKIKFADFKIFFISLQKIT